MREVIAKVLENIPIAEGVYSLTFCCEEEIPVRPGQFAMIGVSGFPLRRPLAICKAEGERYTVCYRVKGEGTTRLAHELKAGEAVSVLFPLGNGFYLAENELRVALVGGGAGVFPLVSALRYYADKKQIFAYMGFKNRDEICMENEFHKAAGGMIATDDGSFGFHGSAVQAFESEVDAIKPDVVFSCGPTPMMRALGEVTKPRKIPTYVSLEERMGCGVGACLVCVCQLTNGAKARVCKDGPVFLLSDLSL